MTQRLKPISRVTVMSLISFFGVFTTLCFLFWLERNAGLPYLPIELGWPWYLLDTDSVGLKLFWNLSLILLLFGFAFLMLSSSAVQKLSARGGSVGATWIVHGLLAWILMGFWQHTGYVLWKLPLSVSTNLSLSVIVFWTLIFMGFREIHLKIGILNRFGYPQLYGRASVALFTPQGIRKDWKALQWFALALWLAPIMSADRAVFAFLLQISLLLSHTKSYDSARVSRR